MLEEWYLKRGDVPTGPYSTRSVFNFIEEGFLEANDCLWRKGSADWLPAIALFEGAFKPSPVSGGASGKVGPPPVPRIEPQEVIDEVSDFLELEDSLSIMQTGMEIPIVGKDESRIRAPELENEEDEIDRTEVIDNCEIKRTGDGLTLFWLALLALIGSTALILFTDPGHQLLASAGLEESAKTALAALYSPSETASEVRNEPSIGNSLASRHEYDPQALQAQDVRVQSGIADNASPLPAVETGEPRSSDGEKNYSSAETKEYFDHFHPIQSVPSQDRDEKELCEKAEIPVIVDDTSAASKEADAEVSSESATETTSRGDEKKKRKRSKKQKSSRSQLSVEASAQATGAEVPSEKEKGSSLSPKPPTSSIPHNPF